MNVWANCWWGQMHCDPHQIFLGGGMAPVAPAAAPPCFLADKTMERGVGTLTNMKSHTGFRLALY